MRFPSNLLAIFSQHGGTQDPNDGVIDVPSTIQPVMETPEQFTSMLLFAGTNNPAVYGTSFIVGVDFIATNQAAIDNTIFTVLPGLWEFEMNWHMSTDVGGTVEDGYIIFKDLNAIGNSTLVSHWSWAFDTVGYQKLKFAIPSSVKFSCAYHVAATALNTHFGFSCFVNGKRLG